MPLARNTLEECCSAMLELCTTKQGFLLPWTTERWKTISVSSSPYLAACGLTQRIESQGLDGPSEHQHDSRQAGESQMAALRFENTPRASYTLRHETLQTEQGHPSVVHHSQVQRQAEAAMLQPSPQGSSEHVGGLDLLARALERHTTHALPSHSSAPATPGARDDSIIGVATTPGGPSVITSQSVDQGDQNGSHGTLMLSKGGRSKYLGPTAGSEWLKDVCPLTLVMLTELNPSSRRHKT